MAEPFGLAASIFATIQIADTIITYCRHFIETARDAPSDAYVIHAEISATRSFFDSWRSMSQANNDLYERLQSLDEKAGPIEGCRRLMRELEKLITADEANTLVGAQSGRGKLKKSLAALKSPLKAGKAMKMLQQLNGYKASISMAMTTESMQDIQEIKAKVNQVYAILTDNQRHELYRSIRHTNPSSLHNRARANYEPGTCDWLLRVPEWQSWMDGQAHCLWIHGIPGAGKTILLSHAIETIQQHCKQQSESRYACVYYYCYFGHDQDETIPFLRWLLDQLCREMDRIPEIITEIFAQGHEPDIEDLIEALESTSDTFDRVYVVLDALDESKKPWYNLLRVIKILTGGVFGKVQLLASSREYGDIAREMVPISLPISMSNAEVEKDIRVCVKSLLCNKRRFGHYTKDLLDEAENSITLGAQGMFRWAVCQIDIIHRLKGDREIILKALQNLPATIYETYDRILDMIPKEEQIFVWNALQWTRCSYDLGLESPSFEIFIEGMADFMREVDPGYNKRFYDEELLQDLCGCLMNIEQVEEDQSGYALISFAHYTVQEYIVSSEAAPNVALITDLRKEDVEGKFMHCILPRLFHIKPESFRVDPGELLIPHSSERSHNINWRGNFDRFCLVSSFAFWSRWQYRIVDDEGLYSLTVSLLNPGKHHLRTLREAVHQIRNVEHAQPFLLDLPLCLWDITWDQDEEDFDLLHLWYILSISYSELRFHSQDYLPATMIVRKHFSENSGKQLLWRTFGPTLRLKDKVEPLGWLGGTVFEVLHQITGWMGSPLFSFFPFFVNEYCAEMDSTPPLCLCLCYSSSTFGDMAVRLIQAGADPEGPNYYVTPLQIAVLSLHALGVKSLLKAGALPDRVGRKTGTRWKHGSYLNPFNCLHGASPLHICLNREDYKKRIDRMRDKLDDGTFLYEDNIDIGGEQNMEVDVDSDTEATVNHTRLIGGEADTESDRYPCEDDMDLSGAVAVEMAHDDKHANVHGYFSPGSHRHAIPTRSKKEEEKVQRGPENSPRGASNLRKLANIDAERKAQIKALLIEHGAEDFCDP